MGSEAGRYIFEILINQSTQLKEMYLNGNYLRNAGAIFVFRGLNINGVLTKIDLTDN